jgi:hypothetical protein
LLLLDDFPSAELPDVSVLTGEMGDALKTCKGRAACISKVMHATKQQRAQALAH